MAMQHIEFETHAGENLGTINYLTKAAALEWSAKVARANKLDVVLVLVDAFAMTRTRIGCMTYVGLKGRITELSPYGAWPAEEIG